MGWLRLSVLVGLIFPPDLLFDLCEMIVGIAEGIVDLCRGQMRIGLPDHPHRITGLCALVDEAHRDAGAHNDGITSANREIFVDITMFSLDRVGHRLIHFIRELCSQYQPPSESSSQTTALYSVHLSDRGFWFDSPPAFTFNLDISVLSSAFSDGAAGLQPNQCFDFCPQRFPLFYRPGIESCE